MTYYLGWNSIRINLDFERAMMTAASDENFRSDTICTQEHSLFNSAIPVPGTVGGGHHDISSFGRFMVLAFQRCEHGG